MAEERYRKPRLPRGGLSASAGVAATAIREAQSDALNPRQAVSVSSSNDLVYISKLRQQHETVYHHDARATRRALLRRWLQARDCRSKSAIRRCPEKIVRRSPAVFRCFRRRENRSLVFAHGARRNVRRPSARFTARQPNSPATLGNDRRPGNRRDCFLDNQADGAGGCAPQSLLRFAPNANGNAAPFCSSTIPGYPSGELALDSTGTNMARAPRICCALILQGVETFPRQFSNNTTLSSIYSLIGMKNSFSGGGVADDPATGTTSGTWARQHLQLCGEHNRHRRWSCLL